MNDSFPPLLDGVANAVQNYADIIEKNYGSATVAVPYYPNTDDSGYPYEVVRFPSINTTKLVGYRAGFPFSAETLEAVKSKNIDIIHSHCPVTSTFLARTLREPLGAPIVFTYHTKFDVDIATAVRGKFLQDNAIKYLCKNIEACDEVWVVSEGAGENLRGLGYQGDYLVMENGVDIPKGRVSDEAVHIATKNYDLPQDIPVFLFVGRIVWYKALKEIIDAMASLKKHGLDFRLVLIGSGADKEDVEKYAEECSVADKCVFTGPIYDRDTLRAWYSRAGLFVFPSVYDTNGLVVREAAACGTASVLTKGSCAAEGVEDGVTGFLVDNTSAALAKKLLEVCRTPEIMKTVGENAMDKIYISWDAAVKKAVDRYEVVIDNYKSGKYPKKDKFMDEWFNAEGELLDGLARGKERRESVSNEMRNYNHWLVQDYRSSVSEILDKNMKEIPRELYGKAKLYGERLEKVIWESLDRYL